MRYARRSVVLALLLSLGASATAQAQEEWWGGFTYQGALTSGPTTDFIDQFSWRNIGLEARKMVSEDASLGVFLGWNVFNDELNTTTSLGSVDISGFQSRFVNAFPMLVTAHYYPGARRSNSARFFVGTGVGTYYTENRAELGLTSVNVNKWHFGIAPEVGVLVPGSRVGDGLLSVKYNYAFEAGGVEHAYWTFGVGLLVGY
jgi:hypothetical protein